MADLSANFFGKAISSPFLLGSGPLFYAAERPMTPIPLISLPAISLPGALSNIKKLIFNHLVLI